MIKITQATDINWINLYRVVYQDEALEIDAALLAQVDAGRDHFDKLIAGGVPCYGVTTGLGKLVTVDLDDAARRELPANILRERATAFGDPFPRAAARAMLVIRLVNFLSAKDGVGSDLCRCLVDRLNQGFTPWIPLLGHGMAADVSANSHAFQTLVGQGYLLSRKGKKKHAAKVLRKRKLAVFEVSEREALALINGVCAAPALAFDAYHVLDEVLLIANLTAAVSLDGLAAPRDAIDPAVAAASSETGIAKVIETLRKHLNHSQVTPFKLQAPVSYRVIPQVHGALFDALALLKQKIEFCCVDFSDNPMLHGDRLLSVGLFHNQHLVNQVEQVALALAHLGALSERRLHRLLDADVTGLNPQLAQRPGIDAGLVATQKACIDLSARLRVLAQPVSLYTGETSGGQEDYMSLAIPAIARLYEMAALTRAILAYEMLAGITAVRMRGQTPGDDVVELERMFAECIPVRGDDAPGTLVASILFYLDQGLVSKLFR